MKTITTELKPSLRKALLALAGAALLAGGTAHAQAVASNVAVPFYTAGDFMRGAYRF